MSRTKTTSAPATTPQAEAPVADRSPMFRPFNWINPGEVDTLPTGLVLDTFCKIRDLAGGTRVLVQMLEQNDLAQWCDDVPPLIGEVDRGDLMRMAITASRIASDLADEVLDWAREHGTKSP
jgi:hypothetical protein